jgi:hypothetical protein
MFLIAAQIFKSLHHSAFAFYLRRKLLRHAPFYSVSICTPHPARVPVQLVFPVIPAWRVARNIRDPRGQERTCAFLGLGPGAALPPRPQ